MVEKNIGQNAHLHPLICTSTSHDYLLLIVTESDIVSTCVVADSLWNTNGIPKWVSPGAEI
jgi:hypothetical protein